MAHGVLTRALSRADDVQSRHAVHLSALTLNPPFSSFLPTPDRGFSPVQALLLVTVNGGITDALTAARSQLRADLMQAVLNGFW